MLGRRVALASEHLPAFDYLDGTNMTLAIGQAPAVDDGGMSVIGVTRAAEKTSLDRWNQQEEPTFVEIYRPQSQQEVILLRMVLEREGIAFYITNERLHSLLPIWDTALGDMRLMVERERAALCRRILGEELGLIPID
ncbi:MAG: hypothetical protein WAN46_09125 [Gammaproteobacteria bacterium]